MVCVNLRQNAFKQATITLFQDLYALPYILNPLTSLEFFFGTMVTIFSDEEVNATAQKVLAACKQGSSVRVFTLYVMFLV